MFLNAESGFGSVFSIQIRIWIRIFYTDTDPHTTRTSTIKKYDAGSRFGSASSLRIRIRILGTSPNADPCRSGSATLLSKAMIIN